MRSIVLVILAFSLIAVTGCGAIKVTPVQMEATSPVSMIEDGDLGLVYLAPGFNAKGIDTLLVLDPSTQAVFEKKEMDPDTMGILLKHELVKQLSDSGAFARVTDDRSILSRANASSGKVLTLEASFSELDPGSRALRWFVGWGAGRTKVQVESEIRDPATRQLYFKASNRKIGLGPGKVFGGESQAFILESLNEIAEAHGAFFKRIASSMKAGRE
jgi:hypothetical protein